MKTPEEILRKLSMLYEFNRRLEVFRVALRETEVLPKSANEKASTPSTEEMCKLIESRTDPTS